MSEEIKKFKFKGEADIQIEVVQIDALIKNNKDYIIKPHRTNFYHIFLLENCSAEHFVDFNPVTIEPYSLLFIDKDRVHKFDKLLNYSGQIIIFTDDFFCIDQNDKLFLRSTILFNDINNNITLKLNEKSYNFLNSICNNIKQELTGNTDSLSRAILKNLIHNLLLYSEREKRNSSFPETDKDKDINLDYTLRFRDLLESNFKTMKTVSEYCTQIYISEKRLGQATSKISGKSPKTIINDRILLETKRLLVYSNLSVKEIGHELGFEDSAYFIRFFKKNTATTPAEFREIQLNR